MHSSPFLKQASVITFAFLLVATLPHAALAQEGTQGHVSSGNSGLTVGSIQTTINNFINNPVGTVGDGIQTVLTTAGNFINHPIATTGNGIQSGLSTVNNVVSGISSFVEHPIATIGATIQGGLQTTSSIISGISSFVEHPIATIGNAVNEIANAVGLGSNNTNAIGGHGPVDLTPPGNSSSGSSDTDSSGSSNGSNANNAGGAGAGSHSGGGSGYRGAVGSVSNPFSTGGSDTTGANSDSIGTDNVQTQSNPYGFEYDPSKSANNVDHQEF